MSKVLKREEITEEILDVIKTAKEQLVIVSPYIKLTKEVREAFEEQNNKVLVRLFFRAELQPSVLTFFDSMPNVFLYSNAHLHTKCYLNEKKVVLTSMNLYEYSMKNNFELGVLLRYKGTDKRSYNEILDEIDFIAERSHCITENKIRDYENRGKTAFCTSCSNPIKPYKNMKLQGDSPIDWQKSWVCKDCRTTLERYEKADNHTAFMEKFGNYCFFCGEEDDFLPLIGLMPVCIKCMEKDLSPIEFKSD